MSRDTGEAFYCGATCETTKNRKSGYVSNEGAIGLESLQLCRYIYVYLRLRCKFPYH